VRALRHYRDNVQSDSRFLRALRKESLHRVYDVLEYLEHFHLCLRKQEISYEKLPDRVICDENILVKLYTVRIKHSLGTLGHPDVIIIKTKKYMTVIELREEVAPSLTEFQERVEYTYEVLQSRFGVKVVYIYFIDKETALPEGYRYDETGLLYPVMYKRRAREKKVYFRPPVIVVSRERFRQTTLF